jgi:hypothetical protein
MQPAALGRLVLLLAVLVLGGIFVVHRLESSSRGGEGPGSFVNYERDGFRVAVPDDLSDLHQNAAAMDFSGDTAGRAMHFETGAASGSPPDWLAGHFTQDAAAARARNVPQQPDMAAAYVFRKHRKWRDGDYYVVSWDDSAGIDHYKAVAAVPGGDGVKWAVFTFDTPISPAIGCKDAIAYMLDTFLMSAGLKDAARDPHCGD